MINTEKLREQFRTLVVPAYMGTTGTGRQLQEGEYFFWSEGTKDYLGKALNLPKRFIRWNARTRELTYRATTFYRDETVRLSSPYGVLVDPAGPRFSLDDEEDFFAELGL